MYKTRFLRKYNIKQPDIYLKAKAIKKVCKTSDKEIIIFEEAKETKIDDNTQGKPEFSFTICFAVLYFNS